MQFGRRIVTILASLALLQLVLLGSAAPCAPSMAEAGRHGSHAVEADDPAHGTSMAEHAHDAGTRGSTPATECGVRACAAPPVIVNGTVVLSAIPPVSSAVDASPDGRPLSPVSSLDPPPPRA